MMDNVSEASFDSGVTWRSGASGGVRKFGPAVGRKGQAREAREAVRSSLSTATHPREGPISQPLDYENFITKHRTVLENDAQRDILLFPRDDIAEFSVNREERTTVSSVSAQLLEEAHWLLTKESLKHYSSPHRILSFNYAKFGSDYSQLAKNTVCEELSEPIYENDIKAEDQEADTPTPSGGEGEIVKEGHLLQYSDNIAVSFNKGFKKRYCIVRKRGEHVELDIHKEQNGPAQSTLIVAAAYKGAAKKGKQTIEVFTSHSGTRPSLLFAADTGEELDQWLTAISHNLLPREDTLSSINDDTQSTGSGAAETGSIGSEDSSISGKSDRSQGWTPGRKAIIALTPPKITRRDLFGLYSNLEPLPHSGNNTVLRSDIVSSPSREEPGVRFMVDCRSLTVKLPISKPGGETFEQIEPFFVRLYVYDNKTSRRVSEEFHTHLNPEKIQHLLDIHSDPIKSPGHLRGLHQDWLSTTGKKAIFSVPRPHAELFLIARVEKVLGNPGTEVAYQKQDSKQAQKLEKAIPLVCNKLGKYRSAFAWTARPVFQEFLGSKKENLPLYKCDPVKASDQDLVKFISDLCKLPEKSGRIHVLPGVSISLLLDLSIRPEDIPNKVTCSFLPIKPFPEPPTGPPVFEVQNFPLDETAEDVRPHSRYINQLYVYPLGLKFDGAKAFQKARNLVCWVQIRDSDRINDKPLYNIYSRFDLNKSGPFVQAIPCAVCHHELCPSFAGEEVKAKLPATLTDKHHILFTFGHISVSGSLSGKTSPNSAVESPCGFAWYPLVREGGNRLNFENQHQEFILPVAIDLPDGYLKTKPLGMGKGFSGPEVKWVENGRGIFRFRLRLISSVFSPEPKLQGFFRACQRLSSLKTLGDVNPEVGAEKQSPKSPSSLEEIGEEISLRSKVLVSVDSNYLTPFLPVVLHQLLSLLPLAPIEDVALTALRTLVSLVDSAASMNQTESLRNYVALRFRPEGNGIHDPLCKFLPQLMRPAYADASTTASLLRQLWFFFELTIKSMGLTLLAEGKHKMTRTERFPADFLYRVEAIIQTLVPLIVARHKELPKETQAANVALAYFMRGCLSLMDRGFVFSLIYFYSEKLDKEDSRGLREFKVDMLQILSHHEHWLALSLPVMIGAGGVIRKNPAINPGEKEEKKKGGNNSSASNLFQRLLSHVMGADYTSRDDMDSSEAFLMRDEISLTPGFAERHFLVGLLLQNLKTSLKESKDLRSRTIAVLRNLFAKHSADPRNMDKIILGRISTLYAPFLSMVVEHIGEIEIAGGEEIPGLRANRDQSKRKTLSSEGGGDYLSLQNATGLSAADSVSSSSSIPVALVRQHGRGDSIGGASSLTLTAQGGGFSERLDTREAKDLIISALFLIRNAPEEILSLLWQQASLSQLADFLKLLELALNFFKYEGKRITMKKTNNRLRLSRRTLTLPSNNLNLDLPTAGESFSSTSPYSVLQEANLSQEIGLTVLDCLSSFCACNKERLASKTADSRDLIRIVNGLLLKLLNENNAENLRLHALIVIGNFVELFSGPFFQHIDSSELLDPLSQALLEQLDSQLATVQRSGAALLLTLLRRSYELSGRSATLGRLGAQLGVALAHLLGDGRPLPNSPAFHRGLVLLETMATRDKKTSHFDRLVQEIIKQLRGVLTATGALKAAEKDPFRLAELHIRLADSYRGSAVLRQAWLESLARLHEKEGSHSEAAMCHVHVAALMMKSLKALDKDEWNLFSAISENVQAEEGRNSDGCSAASYSWDVLAERVEYTAEMLVKASRYESLGPLYRLLVPYYEEKRQYKQLSDCYGKLHEAYSTVVSLQRTQKRALAAYFRVIFYGQFHFPEDQGVEWIYKEVGRTSLAEATEKLRERCRLVLGHDNIKFLSGEEQPEKSSPGGDGVAMVQITHVEPCTEGGSDGGCDEFQRHHNVKKFQFETRLVEEGGTPDDVSRHGKRRVYLTCGKSFPYLLSRLPVIMKRDEVLTPLEVAVEELSKKSSQLEAVLKSRPRDVKRLQLLLQGAVQTTVNAGPLAYARAFTQQEQKNRYGEEGVDRLKRAFQQLLKICAEALEANAELIAMDQMEYQKMLVQSFQEMVEKLNQLFKTEMLDTGKDDADGEGRAHSHHRNSHVFDAISGVRTS